MDVEPFTNLMQQKDWHEVFRKIGNVESEYDEFIETKKVWIHECVLRVTMRDSNKAPWMTKLTLKLAN